MPKLHIIAALAVAATLVAAPALADYEKITDRSEFLDVVSNTTLTRLGIKVQVTPDGGIRGSAFGSPVTGTWSWDSGYFCRDLAWGGDDLGYNCQEVALDGGSIRFTSDKGSGRSASLKLD